MYDITNFLHHVTRYLTDQVSAQNYEANAEFFDHAEQYEAMLNGLHNAALEDKLDEKYSGLPSHFLLVREFVWGGSVYCL